MKKVNPLPSTPELAGAIAGISQVNDLHELDETCENVVETALSLCVIYSRFEGDKRELARGLREISIVLDHAACREELLAPLVHA
jgi:hypothetical protein